VQESEFSSGKGVVVNFSNKDFTLPDGRIVKARDYVKFQRGEQSRSYETPPCRNVFAH